MHSASDCLYVLQKQFIAFNILNIQHIYHNVVHTSFLWWKTYLIFINSFYRNSVSRIVTLIWENQCWSSSFERTPITRDGVTWNCIWSYRFVKIFVRDFCWFSQTFISSYPHLKLPSISNYTHLELPSISNHPLSRTTFYLELPSISNYPLSRTTLYLEPPSISNHPLSRTTLYLEQPSISNNLHLEPPFIKKYLLSWSSNHWFCKTIFLLFYFQLRS